MNSRKGESLWASPGHVWKGVREWRRVKGFCAERRGAFVRRGRDWVETMHIEGTDIREAFPDVAKTGRGGLLGGQEGQGREKEGMEYKKTHTLTLHCNSSKSCLHPYARRREEEKSSDNNKQTGGGGGGGKRVLSSRVVIEDQSLRHGEVIGE